MNDLELNIFNSSESDVIMPGQQLSLEGKLITEESIVDDIENTREMISDDITDIIGADVVKSVLLPEENDILLPNYVIDLSNVGEVEPIQIMALDSLISKDGDVAIYLHMAGGLEKIGLGYSGVLERILLESIKNVFNGKCDIYENYEVGKEVNVMSSKNLGNLKLTI